MKPEKAGDFYIVPDYPPTMKLCPFKWNSNAYSADGGGSGGPGELCDPACAWYDRAADRCAVLSLARGKRA